VRLSEHREQQQKQFIRAGYWIITGVVGSMVGTSFLCVWLLRLSTWWSVLTAFWVFMLFGLQAIVLQGCAVRLLKAKEQFEK
jgi:hypothetical protein